MYVSRVLGFLRDFLLRDCDTTHVGPAILQYVNGGIGNDCKTLKKPSNLATKRTRVKLPFHRIDADKHFFQKIPPGCHRG